MGKQEKESLLESFGNIVQTRRKRAGLTMEEFAWRTDLTETYISQIENGIRNPSLEIIMKLAAALELDHPGILINEDIQEAYEVLRAPIQQRIDESNK